MACGVRAVGAGDQVATNRVVVLVRFRVRYFRFAWRRVLLSGGFWCISNRVAVNREFGEANRSQNVGLSAIHFEMRVLPPLVGVVTIAGGNRRARWGGEKAASGRAGDTRGVW